MTDPFTRASAQYREAMTLPHKSGPAFELHRRPSGILSKLFWGAMNALFGGVCIFGVCALLIGFWKSPSGPITIAISG